MTDQWPKILSRQTTTLSPWMKVIAREIEFSVGAEPQVYHAVGQADYLAVVALTTDGRIPIVRQYRPAVEAFTWELPAGMVDEGETPAESARRELLEETGFIARAMHPLGSAKACTGRLSNGIHSFFAEIDRQAAEFNPEPGIEVGLRTPAELVAMIKTGDFAQQLHLGALMLAELHSFLKLPR